MRSVRRAQPSDRTAVVATVIAAFAGDPAWVFLLGGEYDRLAPHFAGALFDVRAGAGTIWVSGDLAAVAMWDPLDRDRVASIEAEIVWRRYRDLAGDAVHARLLRYNEAVHAAAAEERRFYLGVLATHPEHQGRGLATAVLAPVIAEADERGLPCCLETSTVKNRAFYGRRGFTEATEVALSDGPPTWWLRRPPVVAGGRAGAGACRTRSA